MRPFTTDNGLLKREVYQHPLRLWVFDWTAIRCARALYNRQNREAMEEAMCRIVSALEMLEDASRPDDERMLAFSEAVAEGIDAALMTLPGIKEELERRKAAPTPIAEEMTHGQPD